LQAGGATALLLIRKEYQKPLSTSLLPISESVESCCFVIEGYRSKALLHQPRESGEDIVAIVFVVFGVIEERGFGCTPRKGVTKVAELTMLGIASFLGRIYLLHSPHHLRSPFKFISQTPLI